MQRDAANQRHVAPHVIIIHLMGRPEAAISPTTVTKVSQSLSVPRPASPVFDSAAGLIGAVCGIDSSAPYRIR